MNDYRIRGYRPDDQQALLDLWEAALPLDAIDAPTLSRKVLLDPNVDPDWLLVAEDGSGLLGFLLAIIRREPFPGVGLEPEHGWITAFGVRPAARGRGIGTALLDTALGLFAAAGRQTVGIAPYVPNYIVPGVDVAAYADGLAYLLRHGFEVVSRPLSMDANLVTFDFTPYVAQRAELAAVGIDVRALRPDEAPALLTFLTESQPPDWLRAARALLAQPDGREQITVAMEAGAVVGYCQYAGEHFGPFGVRADRQGQGLGTVLLATTLGAMRRRGLHNAWVLWTSDDAAERVYRRFGFGETRRFAVCRRKLS
ncbi:MAG: GNAT family N-acetyltransferase [Armatimonadetes bacterium]|nr:GNAT family N-acetyltransferase [Armatimonadota bacterium]